MDRAGHANTLPVFKECFDLAPDDVSLVLPVPLLAEFLLQVVVRRRPQLKREVPEHPDETREELREPLVAGAVAGLDLDGLAEVDDES